MNKTKQAQQKFGELIERELKRMEALKNAPPAKDFKNIQELKIGVCAGDGIGPAITQSAVRVLNSLLADDIAAGKVKIVMIEGLTLENRLRSGKAIPDDVLEAIKDCDVILKGPTTTPSATGGMMNLPSANVAMRKVLDLYMSVRPVKVAEEGIDWIFFRENTEGSYSLGSDGIEVDEEVAVDFTVTTNICSERIIRAAFEYAKQNGKTRVTAVTKANIIKTTDGKFLRIFNRIAADYPGISADDLYVDIATAKLLDKERGKLQVFVLPNLYGDIITDEAAEIQGGVGTAGSANIGARYAMFEAIHGSAPRMFLEGRAEYADPSSMLRASEMLLRCIGRTAAADKLDAVLTAEVKDSKITGYNDGMTTKEFTESIISKL